MTRIKTVFMDLDNTLYDWLAFFAPAFRGMSKTLSELSGIRLSSIYDEFRDVFRMHGTVEYSYALQELASIRSLHPGLDGSALVERYRPAVDSFQHYRRDRLKLYPGMFDTMREIRRLGVSIVALTDAHGFHAALRIKQLGIESLIDVLVSRKDHQDVSTEQLSLIRRYPADRYHSKVEQMNLPDSLRKPDPGVLLWLTTQMGLDPEQCVMVGDNLIKDVRMAQKAGIADCWAEYGTRVNPADLATLLQITHLSGDAIQAAIHPTPEMLGVDPTYMLKDPYDLVSIVTSLSLRRPMQRRHASGDYCPNRTQPSDGANSEAMEDPIELSAEF
ncbi:MAG TPA: HAD family hydrolase [Pseudonocardiaceae bacterium]|nr:HAD family hydrolase [Pseudonocardiaceae bacterium]